MKNLLEITQFACLKAGAEIMKFYKSQYNITDKGYHNPVTDADFAANTSIHDILRNEYPGYGWLSEETADSQERLSRTRVWIVDPLDGTKEFIEGVPNFVVSIGLVENGIPILGVLYNPVTQEMMDAARGMGARYNGSPVTCSNKTKLNESSVVISRSETRKGLWKGTESWFSEQAHIGSVAYKLGLTASGKYDSFATLRPKNEWDVCAGHVILKEAGGLLLNLADKSERMYNQPNPLITPGLVGGNAELIHEFSKLWENKPAS
ncbi:MAG: 3'(2'),5'-bisphosphate nucleotidase CysQ [Candidatus Marinimicrobia bacterium]|jgi:myo-inositol-1(or 4)-monophosphatase|nr:3'(2'),5'-bisphosphate nucleotidase CysQ [Candidatus Neomarinimicrobiota bacterium]MBT3633219.1 3'(2'),5'-bisphosphate nucleotidase CysQ [Candidatus Neomarinimicrobiota bacterium]MBT3682180.1 3'(2'),5'-bisphosphate nucleotidase CysQ [Candidatus Neomarinimicrobiota bacterium]MBT3758819.1 3'(2'),5'-bisphosphate nucleotidase CysQ [Candidatus Neomarinimicrobiota bacterium]MBT3895306.1 3'(2'),5'-bisphosphate nucleotidase CysQ [Candidatus Neomarinimicrobiota bacterium]